MEFTALVFGPGLPGGGERMGVQMDRGSLDFHTRDGRILEVPLSQLRVQLSESDHNHWQIGWELKGEPWMLLLDHTAVQNELLGDPPPGLKPQLARLRKAQNAARRGKSARLSAPTMSLIAPLVLVIALLLNADRFAGWIVRYVSVDQETQFGQIVWAAQRASLRLVEGTAANDAVETLGERLTQGSAYRYRWRVAIDPRLDAFAVPGGDVVVTSGMILAADSAEELAGLLAHEIQHIEQRHALKASARQAGIATLMVLLVGEADGAAQLGSDIAGLKFPPAAEREADLGAVDALARARIDPQGLATCLARLQERAAAGEQVPWLKEHPGGAERVAAIGARLGQLGDIAIDDLPLRWPKVQASLADQAP
ncbi:MAG TPA: M48 family metallopeptidase [Solimonas sp.]|nr:M48 family metallopeptidase [Solimonas sp.]